MDFKSLKADATLYISPTSDILSKMELSSRYVLLYDEKGNLVCLKSKEDDRLIDIKDVHIVMNDDEYKALVDQHNNVYSKLKEIESKLEMQEEYQSLIRK